MKKMYKKKVWTVPQMEQWLKENLKEKRYLHTMRVAHTASCLAMCHEKDVRQAYLAGLLHDNAKCIADKKKLALCTKYKLTVSAIERQNPDLLHAKLGACLAKEKFYISNEDILNAIANHTTGRSNMSSLEKIVYIADFIEPGRDESEISQLKEARKLAFSDLDETMLYILKHTLSYLERKGAAIDSKTEEAYQYYCNIETCKH